MTQSYAERSAERFDRRPGILTLTAGLLAAYGIGSMMAGVSSAGDPKVVAQMAEALPGFHRWLLTHYGGHGLVALSTFQGLLLISTAIGVWMLRPWGRLLLYFVSFLGVALVVEVAIVSRQFGVFTPLWIFLFGWPMWYLGRPHVKEAFTPPAKVGDPVKR